MPLSLSLLLSLLLAHNRLTKEHFANLSAKNDSVRRLRNAVGSNKAVNSFAHRALPHLVSAILERSKMNLQPTHFYPAMVPAKHATHVFQQRRFKNCIYCHTAARIYLSQQCEMFEDKGLTSKLDPRQPLSLAELSRKSIQDAIDLNGRSEQCFVMKCTDLGLPNSLCKTVIMDRYIRQYIEEDHLKGHIIYFYKRPFVLPNPYDDNIRRLMTPGYRGTMDPKFY